MNKARLLLIALPLLLAGPLWFANQKRVNSARYVLSQYPQSWPMNYIRQSHLEFKDFRGQGLTVFNATWFIGEGPELQMSSWAESTGNAGFSRLDFVLSKRSVLHKTVSRGGKWFVLPNADYLRLRSLLSQMPPSDAPIKQWDIVVITFNQGMSYETRVYDRAHLPQTVKGIFQLMGAPAEVSKQ